MVAITFIKENDSSTPNFPRRYFDLKDKYFHIFFRYFLGEAINVACKYLCTVKHCKPDPVVNVCYDSE